MAEGWYVGRNGEQSGPFSPQQLKQMANAGQLSPADLLWKDGMPNWVPCSSVKGLFLEPNLGTTPPSSRPALRPTAPPPRGTVPSEANQSHADQTSFNDWANSGITGPHSSQPSAASQYAEFLPRVGALLLDGLFAGLMGCVPAFGLAIVFMAMAGASPDSQQGALAFSNCCGQIVYQLIAVTYFVTLETSAKQGTWGKQIVGIKVTDLQGNRITVGRALGRYFAKIITGLTCGIGLVMPLFTEKKQTLHDMIAGCLSLKK
jgi:uncharacterized RDD family membrane protein YckC